eukprot:GILI01007785.1.p1 GENE.GILI01007785.1~~GILI01007785.1.p1  ORF type:complete len:845 (+),score=135.53 GILI01007785.1:236-2536(+)
MKGYTEYNAGGAYAKTNITGPGAPKYSTWNLWAVDTTKAFFVQNETVGACLGVYPLDPALCPKFTQHFDTAITIGSPERYTASNSWAAPGRLAEASIPGAYTQLISFLINVDPTKRPYSIFCASFALDHVAPIIVANVATANSRTAVYTEFYDSVVGTTQYRLVGGKFDFLDYDAASFAASGYDFFSSAWIGGKTPDPILNAVFVQSYQMFANETTSWVFEFSYGGNDYVASVARVVDSESDFNWLLTEYTPREDFFGASDRARMIGILIGVLGALVVLITCILIWVAIRSPLRSLHAGMGLAADMRNDEVVHINPTLSEIRDLNCAFKQMNAKLLVARPFLPQSLLQASVFEEEAAASESVGEDAFCSTRGRSFVDDGDSSPAGASESGDDYKKSRRSNELVEGRQTRVHNGIVTMAKEIEFRRVAILSINVLGFHGNIGAQGNASICAIHSALARIVEQSTGEERGIVDYFHGDRFVCGFNTARLCGNGARNGAETATKIWNRFQSQHDGTMGTLLSVFPLGLAMGLSVGRAAVGNHGTETMQRLATIGGVYTEATRLQEVMCRRVLMGSGSLNPLVSGRCLTMGRVVQDLETSNVHCQILGAVPAQLFLPSAEACNEKNVLSFALARNLAIGRITASDEGDSFAVSQTEVSALSAGPCHTTVLVAAVSALSAVKGSRVADDEWLYEMNSGKQRNPFLEANGLIQKLWLTGEVKADSKANLTQVPAGNVIGAPDSLPARWLQHVTEVIDSALGNSQTARMKLMF